MRSVAPALLPIFRSQLQADLLAALLLNPEQEQTMTEIAHRFDAPLSTVHNEVKRLTEAGLLRRRSVGRTVLVQANSANRLVQPLAELLLLSWGPAQVVAEEFRQLDATEQVLIFGSWAARYQQHAGPPPHDLDVLVVGSPPQGAVYDAADRAQLRLAIPVNPVVRPDVSWQDGTDPLIQQIQARPFVTILAPDDTADSGLTATTTNDG